MSFLLCDPGWYISNKLDVQNEWEESKTKRNNETTTEGLEEAFTLVTAVEKLRGNFVEAHTLPIRAECSVKEQSWNILYDSPASVI